MRAAAASLVLLVPLAAACGSTRESAAPTRAAAGQGGDWARFGYTAARRNAGPAASGITAANVSKLKRQEVKLDGTVDASAIYLRGATVKGARHDVFLVT